MVCGLSLWLTVLSFREAVGLRRLLAFVLVVGVVVTPAAAVAASHLSPGCDILNLIGSTTTSEFVINTLFADGEVVTVNFTGGGGREAGVLDIADSADQFGNPRQETTSFPETLTHTFDGTETGVFIFVAAIDDPLAVIICDQPSPGDVVINEIMQNPAAVSDSAGEWFELVNTTASPIDIEGWTIADVDFDSHVISNGGPLVIPANGYLVLGNNDDNATNGGVSVDYNYGSSFFLANGDDELVLLDGGLTEIDRVEWDNGATFPDPNGASMALDDPANDNNVGANWCTASTPYGDGDLGTPGAANDCSGGGGGLNPGDVVINEIMQNPAAVSDSAGEWFEVFNTTSSPIDLNGLVIRDADFDSHTISSSVIVPAGGFAVLGRNSDSGTNGGVTVDYQYAGFFLGNSSDEVVILDGTTEIDRVDYDNGATFPDPNGASMALFGPSLDNNVGSNWCTSPSPYGAGDSGTPGGFNDCSCGDPATLIHDIQGSGASSPEDGNTHAIEGVVVGDFQDTATELGGFFVQEEDSDADTDGQTSEGIFVFDNGFGVDVAIGDVVRVHGTVDEFFDLTELNAVTNVGVCPFSGTASAAIATLPLDPSGDFENVEGMSVHFPQTLVVTDNFGLGRFGELALSLNSRLDNPTNATNPGPGALAHEAKNDRSRIILDDGSTVQNQLPLPPYLDGNGTRRVGSSVKNLTGVMSFSFGDYRIQPTDTIPFVDSNPRPDVPDVGGDLTVAAFNVLNYFNGDGLGGGFPTPRGADTQGEFDRQRDKIIAAIVAMDADVIGLMEIENDGYAATSAIADLVNGLNAASPATYAYINPGVATIGADAIAVGLIYQPANVTPVGAAEILDSSDDPTFLDTKNRPVLTQTFEDNATGEVFTVAVNHLKSKGSPCNDVGDPNTGDGQGNCNGVRTAAATALANWLAGDPTGSGDPDFLIIGDLNAYPKEDPIDALNAAGYTDLVKRYQGSGQYSFVFFGESGQLDHALANKPMRKQVTGAALWHINADEPVSLDYNEEFNQPGLYNPDPFRSSDHDPIIIGLDLS